MASEEVYGQSMHGDDLQKPVCNEQLKQFF